jgi:putative salt-induced outer membrane protein
LTQILQNSIISKKNKEKTLKKIVLSVLASASLLLSAELSAEQQQKIQDDIAKTKAQMSALDAKVKKLQAQLPPPPPNEDLKTHAELGYIKTSGNTKTDTFNLNLKMEKPFGAHKLTYLLDGQYASDKDKETKNKFVTELEYFYSFTDRFSATYLVGYKRDKFSGFDYQAYTGPGIEYKVIKEAKHELDLSANILYSVDKLEDSIDDTNDYAGYRAKALYGWQILKNLKFTQEVSYRGSLEDSDDYFVYAKSAIFSKVSDIFSVGASYQIDYANNPPSDKKYTDETFTVNLIADF